MTERAAVGEWTAAAAAGGSMVQVEEVREGTGVAAGDGNVWYAEADAVVDCSREERQGKNLVASSAFEAS